MEIQLPKIHGKSVLIGQFTVVTAYINKKNLKYPNFTPQGNRKKEMNPKLGDRRKKDLQS